MTSRYSETVNKIPAIQRNDILVRRELVLLGSENEKLERAVERAFASQCLPSLYTLKFHPVNHLVEALETFGSMHCLNTTPLEQLDVLTKQSCRSMFQRLSTRLLQGVSIMDSTVQIVQKAGDRGTATHCKKAVLKNMQLSGQKGE